MINYQIKGQYGWLESEWEVTGPDRAHEIEIEQQIFAQQFGLVDEVN